MNPKKHHDIILQTANEFQLDPKCAKLLIETYYKTIRKELAEINKTRIQVTGLGYFDLKYWKVKYRLADTANYILHHEKTNTEKAVAIICNLKRKLAVLERAEELAKERRDKKIDKHVERWKYINSFPDIDPQPQKDSGGGLE